MSNLDSVAMRHPGMPALMDENLHPAHRARAAMARLGHLIEEADPVERMIEDRERRDALRDVERRRLAAGLRRGGWRDDRESLP